MHRFVWDFHYPPPLALTTEFPISAIVHDTVKMPLGAWALPGSYTFKLTVDGQSYSQPLALRMDPRVKTSAEDLRKQFEMESGAVKGMDASYRALEEVQSVRAQLKELAAKAKGKPGEGIAALDKQCADLEGAAQSAFYGVPSNGKKPENFSTLNQHFAAILATADSADLAPTTQATAVFHELETDSANLQKSWDALRNQDMPALNLQLKKANLPLVDPKKALPQKPGGVGDGDDEP